jgi:uncharacterized cofD-like protein
MLNVVSIGGGGGAVQILNGLRPYTRELTGIIAVTDTGRSTGKVRDMARIPAPGDIRNALGTLAGENGPIEALIQHRLKVPHVQQLDGVAFGNLMLAALTQMYGDFGRAVEEMRKILGVDVRIYPVTTHNTHVCAELADGSFVEEEFNVRRLNKPAIKRVYIQDRLARVYAPALRAIDEADLITIGPGSLFTSVLACLAFEELSAAIQTSRAKVVYVCNNTTQPGQTDDLSLADHVRQVKRYLNGRLDWALLNSRTPGEALRAQYAADGVQVLPTTPDEVRRVQEVGVRVLVRDLAQLTEGKRELYDKQDSIRHDPAATAAALIELMAWTGCPWTPRSSSAPMVGAGASPTTTRLTMCAVVRRVTPRGRSRPTARARAL